MKKLLFPLGVGFGFILGSKAGPRPYEQLEAKARSVTSRPKVQETKAKVKRAAGDKVDEVTNRVGQHVPDAGDSSRPGDGYGTPGRARTGTSRTTSLQSVR